MKRETELKWKGLAWCTPFFIVAVPFILLAFACDYLADVTDWIHGKVERLSAWVGDKLTPPVWWPSHKYLTELNEMRAQKRKEYVDRMQSRVHKTPAKEVSP